MAIKKKRKKRSRTELYSCLKRRCLFVLNELSYFTLHNSLSLCLTVSSNFCPFAFLFIHLFVHLAYKCLYLPLYCTWSGNSLNVVERTKKMNKPHKHYFCLSECFLFLSVWLIRRQIIYRLINPMSLFLLFLTHRWFCSCSRCGLDLYCTICCGSSHDLQASGRHRCLEPFNTWPILVRVQTGIKMH